MIKNNKNRLLKVYSTTCTATESFVLYVWSKTVTGVQSIKVLRYFDLKYRPSNNSVASLLSLISKSFVSSFFTLAVALLLNSCEETLVEQNTNFGQDGEIVFCGYAYSGDTVQITSNDSTIATFTKSKTIDYGFIKYYYTDKALNFKVLNDTTKEFLQSYEYSFTDDYGSYEDTISFFYKSTGIWIDDVLSLEVDTLSASTNTGYRFIFPNMNYFSNSGYTGKLDAIITRFPTGIAIDTLENINTDAFSDFVEFTYAAPPLIQLELVEHGTTESYLDDGTSVTVTLSISKSTSKLIVLEETADDNGDFAGVSGSIDLTEYFDY